jgi:hypothetical protein
MSYISWYSCYMRYYRYTSLSRKYTKKTEGLELGAVDKLLVGILVGREGKGETLVSILPNHPIYSVILSNNIIQILHYHPMVLFYLD